MQPANSVPHLDLYTVKVMTLVTVVVVGLATMLAWRANLRSAGMRLFALGIVTLAVGALLGIARVIFAGPAIIVASNVFMLGGIIVIATGVRVFRDFKPWPMPYLVAFCATVAAPFLYWLVVEDNFGMRVAVVSGAHAILLADAAISMFRRVRPRERLTYWPTGASFAFATLYLAARCLSGWSGAYGASLFVASPAIEMFFTVCANVAYTGCAVGMILASNTQLWQQAETMALRDSLTGLPNRRYFLDHLLAAETRALASGQQMGIIYLDLDGFKQVNDRFGHAAGDALLQNVSSALVKVLRAGDCAARLGGDEFVVLAERLESREQLLSLASRVKQAVESDPVPDANDEPVRVSLGLAVFPQDGRTAHDVLREADSAMYHTKRQSRWAEPAHR
jgi:diguanylate cyclase (GGDEF)-like protein